jgi:hypothetical protein
VAAHIEATSVYVPGKFDILGTSGLRCPQRQQLHRNVIFRRGAHAPFSSADSYNPEAGAYSAKIAPRFEALVRTTPTPRAG